MLRRRIPRALAIANLALLGLYPVAWFAPLLSAALPVWGGSTVSVVAGLQTLWQEDVGLAFLLTFFAVFAPYLKTIGLALVHFRLASPRILVALHLMGKLAMADIFLVAIYIIAFRGIGLGTVTLHWGTWAFTLCVLASIVIGFLTERGRRLGPR
ncbi:MAG: paraquat-inducible protein A [Rhodobacteraceae bacterium]|nr:paraquat-inducible protein A [Paracoccaceae bacterium]